MRALAALGAALSAPIDGNAQPGFGLGSSSRESSSFNPRIDLKFPCISGLQHVSKICVPKYNTLSGPPVVKQIRGLELQVTSI